MGGRIELLCGPLLRWHLGNLRLSVLKREQIHKKAMGIAQVDYFLSAPILP